MGHGVVAGTVQSEVGCRCWIATELFFESKTKEYLESESRVGEQGDTKQMKVASLCVSDLCGVTTPGSIALHQHSWH